MKLKSANDFSLSICSLASQMFFETDMCFIIGCSLLKTLYAEHFTICVQGHKKGFRYITQSMEVNFLESVFQHFLQQ